MNPSADPHAGATVYAAGAPLDQADSALILLHGRGATAQDILPLGLELASERTACLAPQAVGFQWYPQRFLVARQHNQPWLDAALALVGRIYAQVAQAGIAPDRIGLAGFSQGACLALDYAARNPRRYAAVLGFSGGLIGTDEEIGPLSGSLDGTPVFLGCSDVDPHIPAGRVLRSSEVFTALGAAVTLKLYPGLGHTVNHDEIKIGRDCIAKHP